MINSMTLKDAALAYAAAGYPVFPLIPGSKIPHKGSNGFKNATTDSVQIDEWWSEQPDSNIGMPVGQGIIAIDLDINHGESSSNGLETFEVFTQAHGSLPSTASCRTPRGGKHLYYRVGETVSTHSYAAAGVDIGGEGHYMLLPPSSTEFGQYQWEDRSIIDGIADANDTVMLFLSSQNHAKTTSKASCPGLSASNDRTEYTDNEIIPEGGRHSFLLHHLGRMQRAGLSDETIRDRINGLNQTRCDPPMDEEELEREIFEALDRYPKGKGSAEYGGNSCDVSIMPDKWKIAETLNEMDIFANPKYSGLNDIALSRIFADCLKDVIRYNATARKWMYYDNVKWATDADRMSVDWLAKEFYDAIYITSTEIEDEAMKDTVRKRIAKLNSRPFRIQMIDDAKSDYAVENKDFDRNPDLFNCQNCVIDLSTGRTIPHSPDLMLSKVSNAVYQPDAESTIFQNFLRDIMLGDQDKMNYQQTILGYALNGSSEREEAYILYGSTTRNGKSTLLDTVRHLFGDYGMNVQPETLAQKSKDSRNASGDIARLDGCRLVQMPEPPKNMKFDVALLKQMTGNDIMTARRLYESDFEFKPVFKLFINTNYLPVVVDDTLFRSGRIKVITFDRQFKPEEQDQTLKTRLISEDNLSAILNWLLEGNRRGRLERTAFIPPASVKAATEAYQQSSDKVQCFINDRLDEDSDYVLSAGTLYTEFEQWCRENGYGVDKKSSFFDELRKKNLLINHGTICGKTARNVVKGYRIISMSAEPF